MYHQTLARRLVWEASFSTCTEITTKKRELQRSRSVTRTTSPHVSRWCSSAGSGLQLLPKMSRYLGTPPKQICMDNGQEEPSHFSTAPLRTPNVAPKTSAAQWPHRKRMSGPEEQPLPSFGHEKTTRSPDVSTRISEASRGSRIAWEPGCVPAERRARHAPTHPQELPQPARPPACSCPPPPTPLLLLATSKPQRRRKEALYQPTRCVSPGTVR